MYTYWPPIHSTPPPIISLPDALGLDAIQRSAAQRPSTARDH